MVLFIDTNIAIGYTIMCDRVHKKVTEFIDNSSDDVYWSNCVQSEFNRKFKSIVKNISNFLNKVSLVLDDCERDFLNYFEFENYVLSNSSNCILDKSKKIKILEFFWNTKILNNFIPIGYFTNFSHELKREYNSRRDFLLNLLILHDCGLDNYLKYNALFKKLKNIGIHSPDNKIILDANDLAFKVNNLFFITTDKELYELISKTNFLNIDDYILIN